MKLKQTLKNLVSSETEPSHGSDLETFLNGGNLSPELKDQLDMEEYQNKIKRVTKKLPLERQYRKAKRLERQVDHEENIEDQKQTLDFGKEEVELEQEKLTLDLKKEENHSLRIKLARLKRQNEEEEFGKGRTGKLAKRYAEATKKMQGSR